MLAIDISTGNIKAGFEATGIWPVQPSRVLNELLQLEACKGLIAFNVQVAMALTEVN